MALIQYLCCITWYSRGYHIGEVSIMLMSRRRSEPEQTSWWYASKLSAQFEQRVFFVMDRRHIMYPISKKEVFDKENKKKKIWMATTVPLVSNMCQSNRPTLVQIMTCCLFDANSLSEPMITYCQFDHQEETLVKFCTKEMKFLLRKLIWNNLMWNGGYFVSASVSYKSIRCASRIREDMFIANLMYILWGVLCMKPVSFFVWRTE